MVNDAFVKIFIGNSVGIVPGYGGLHFHSNGISLLFKGLLQAKSILVQMRFETGNAHIPVNYSKTVLLQVRCQTGAPDFPVDAHGPSP